MRMLRLALVFTIAALALDWAPGIPPYPLIGVAQVRAQTFPTPLTPGGAIVYSSASETCVNTANECQMFQWTVPAAYIATAPAINTLVSQWLDGASASGFHTPVLWTTPQPLHLRMLGAMGNAAGDNINIGVNFGGTAASVSLSQTVIAANTFPNEGVIRLDVWITPIASTTATPSGTNTTGQGNLFLAARVEYPSGFSKTIATATIISSQTISSVNLASPNQLNVLWRWGAGNNTSSVRWLNRILKIGE